MGFFAQLFGHREDTTVSDYTHHLEQGGQNPPYQVMKKPSDSKIVPAYESENVDCSSDDSSSDFWESSTLNQDRKLTVTIFQAQKMQDLIQTLLLDLEDYLDEIPPYLETALEQVQQKTHQALWNYYTYNTMWEADPQNPELAEYYSPAYDAACDAIKAAYRCLRDEFWNIYETPAHRHQAVNTLRIRAQNTADLIRAVMPTAKERTRLLKPSDSLLISEEERFTMLDAGQRIAEEALIQAQQLVEKMEVLPERRELENLALAYESGASDLVLALENYADCVHKSQMLHVDFVAAFRQAARILRALSEHRNYEHILEYVAGIEEISLKALEEYSLADDSDTARYILDRVQQDVPEQTLRDILDHLVGPYQRYISMLLTQWDIYALGNFAPLMVSTYATRAYAYSCYDKAFEVDGHEETVNDLQAWNLAQRAHDAVVWSHRYAYTDYLETYQSYDDDEFDDVVLQNISENTREFVMREADQMATAWGFNL